MLFFRKKARQRVMQGKPFVAAYSKQPFAEAEEKARYPDYAFYKSEGMHWCVRVGEIAVPWGIAEAECGFFANGQLILGRGNVSGECFDGKGLPVTSRGGIHYFYECELGPDGFYGFVPAIRAGLLPSLKSLAKACADPADFEKAAQSLTDRPEVAALLREHRLYLKRIIVDKIGKEIRS